MTTFLKLWEKSLKKSELGRSFDKVAMRDGSNVAPLFNFPTVDERMAQTLAQLHEDVTQVCTFLLFQLFIGGEESFEKLWALR
jgi:hypothetical protein